MRKSFGEDGGREVIPPVAGAKEAITVAGAGTGKKQEEDAPDLLAQAVHDLGDGGFTIAYGQGGKDDAFTVVDVSAAVGLLMVGDSDLRVRDGRVSEPLLIASWCDASDSAPPVGVLCVGRWVRVDCDDEIVVARIEEPEYPGGLNAWACACDSGWQTVRPPDLWHPLAPFGGE